MQRLFIFILPALLTSNQIALANNSNCLGDSTNDPTRPVLSCTPITERFLFSLHNMSKAGIIKAMNTKGRVIPHNSTDQIEELRFLSNAAQGSGFLNVAFKDGYAFIIHAYVDAQHEQSEVIEYIWNAELGGCSDFPKSRNTCRPKR